MLLLLSFCLAGTPAEELARLRAEVDTLSTELSLSKEEAAGRLRAFEAQRADLEVQLRRETLRLDRLVLEAAQAEADLREGGRDPELVRVVEQAIDALRAEVRGGLPFKQGPRLAALEDLETKLREEVLPAEQVAARLWAFAEDERRLARETSLDRQVVPLDGEQVLVDTARVGMVALYWRAQDGRVGRTRRDLEGWSWSALEGAEARQVEGLFDALDHGLSVGWFELPGVLQEVSR